MGISKVGKAAKQKELPLVVDGKAKWYHQFEKDGDVLIWETIISLSMGAPDCCVGSGRHGSQCQWLKLVLLAISQAGLIG